MQMANISYFCTMLHFWMHIAHIHCSILIRSTGSRGKSTFEQRKMNIRHMEALTHKQVFNNPAENLYFSK